MPCWRFVDFTRVLLSLEGDAAQVDGAAVRAPDRLVGPDIRSPDRLAGREDAGSPDGLRSPDRRQVGQSRSPDRLCAPQRVVDIDADVALIVLRESRAHGVLGR